MTVQDVISKIESVDKQIKNLQFAEDRNDIPDDVNTYDIVDLLTEYKVLLLEMKIEKK